MGLKSEGLWAAKVTQPRLSSESELTTGSIGQKDGISQPPETKWSQRLLSLLILSPLCSHKHTVRYPINHPQQTETLGWEVTMQHNNVATTLECYLLLSQELFSALLPLLATSLCECCHLHILHKIEMANRSTPAVPVSILVLMK